MENDVKIKGIMTVEDLQNSIKNAQYLYWAGDFQKAYIAIKEVTSITDTMISIGLQGGDYGPRIYAEVYMLAGDICGELGLSNESLLCYKKHQFFKFQIRHDFTNCNSVTLYKFCNTRHYTLNNLKNNEISLADPRIQNDIVDSPIFAWLDTLCGSKARYKKHIPYLKKSFDGIRCASFCADCERQRAVENTLMWAHYANCHKGICIEYVIDKSDFRTNDMRQLSATTLLKVNYLDPHIKPLDFTDSKTILSARHAYALKSMDWNYENEVRFVAYTPFHDTKFVQYQFNTQNPVKAVYFGCKCPVRNINKIKSILHGQNVRFFQMRINPKNIHRLVYEECS